MTTFYTTTAIILSVLLPMRATATTIVLADERELTRQSTVVLTGEVVDVDAQLDAPSGGIYTRVRIEPEQVVVGDVPADGLVLHELGGELDSMLQQVEGSATYAPGERVLVFAGRSRAGTLRTTGMAMGKYTLTTAADGSVLAVRRLGHDVELIDPQTGEPDSRGRQGGYRLDELLDSIAAAARGDMTHAPAPLTDVAPVEGELLESAFTYIGAPARWLEFERGESVPYLVDRDGDATLGAAVSLSAVQQGMAAWNSVAGANISMVYGGEMSADSPFGCNGPSTIRFNDLFNYIADPVYCRGVVAISTFCRDSKQTVAVNGKLFNPIVSAHTIFANGWGACPNWNECTLAEIATHELGHTIGIGHSTVPKATMWPSIHSDRRCATLLRDDVEAANFIYPTGASNHDGVILPRNPVTVRFPATAATATKRLSINVRNGASRGAAGVFRLVVTRNSCPGAVVEGLDFGRAAHSAPDTVLLAPGESRRAQLTVSFAEAAIPGRDNKTPVRCVVGLKLQSTAPDNADPTPLNDSIEIEMNVIAASGSSASSDMPEAYIKSPAPLQVRFALGARAIRKRVSVSISNTGSGDALEQRLNIDASDGNCPAGTVSNVTLGPVSGSSEVMVPTGGTRTGRIELDLDPTRLATLWPSSPTRCTMTLRVTGSGQDAEPSNNSTSLVIDVTDANDL